MLSYLRWLSRAVPRLRPATVYMFHNVGYQPMGCDTHTPEVFDAFLAWLTPRATVLPLGQLCEQLRRGRPSTPLAALTFDDGCLDNYTHAYPILRKYDCPASYYVVTDWVGGPDRMTRAMVREVADNGVTVGSHTVSHPRLSTLPPDKVRQELRDSRAWISDLTGLECTEFCYPYGDYSPAVKRLVAEEGYACAAAVSLRGPLNDRFAVPRVVLPTTVSPRRFAVSLFAPGALSLIRLCGG
jgi:peptidoglycan/xylan/chitin deacetylase (PgdA/CDA1 family)